jgi:aminoglycoside phosphotransferase (APT) family kinase protein
MTQPPALDPQSILVSLGINDAAQFEPVTGGADTAIWRVTWHDQFYALRVFRPEQRATYEREVAAMQVASNGGIPVPAVIRQGMWGNRPVLFLSWMAGKTLAERLLERPHLGWRLGRAFGQMQAAIHKVAIPPDVDTTHWIEWAGDTPELKTRLYNLKPRRAALLHLDYHPLNVMVEDTHVSGVLDWANAQFGDPRADIARTNTILRVEPYRPEGDSVRMALYRRILHWAWRAGYTQGGGVWNDMALFYAWAGAVMIRDLSVRIGKPGHWLENHHLDPVRRWQEVWKQRAGIRL